MSENRIAQVTINNSVPEVSVDEVYRTLGRVRLIDVRRPDEFNGELGHIEGAELITLGPQLVALLYDSDKNQEIIFVCRSGGRSDAAAREALSMGYKYVANMVGGMLHWNEKKYPALRS